MTGKRKLIIAILSLVVYAVVMIWKTPEPFQTGLGIAAIAGVIIWGYKEEYRNK